MCVVQFQNTPETFAFLATHISNYFITFENIEVVEVEFDDEDDANFAAQSLPQVY